MFDRLTVESNFFQFLGSAEEFYSSGIMADHFDTLRGLFIKTCEYIADYQESPEFAYLQKLDDRLKTVDYKITFREAVKNLKTQQYSEEITKINTKYTTALEKGREPEAVADFIRQTSELQTTYIANTEGSKEYNIFDQVDQHFSDEGFKNYWEMPFPFPTLANRGIHINSGNFCVVYAPTGIGKSWLMLKFYLEWSLMGYSGIFLTYEMTERECAQRLYLLLLARFADELEGRYTLRDLSNPKVYKSDVFKRDIALVKDKLPEGVELVIKKPSSANGLKLHNIKALIESGRHHFYIIDGIYLMEEGKFNWDTFGEMIAGIKQLALQYNVPIIGTNQEAEVYKKKDNNNNDNQSSTNMPKSKSAFGQAIPRSADMLFYLGYSERAGLYDQTARMLRVEKLRNYKVPDYPIKLDFDVDKGIIKEHTNGSAGYF